MAKFSAEILTSKAECKSVLDFIAGEKDDLTVEQIVNAKDDRDGVKSTSKINQAIAAAQVEFDKEDAALTPDLVDQEREFQITRRMKAEVKLLSLNERKATMGALALFRSDYDDNVIETKLAFLVEKEAEVVARDQALPA